MTTPVQERIEVLCSEFRLPTIGAEVVNRFQVAEHGAALETLLSVFELEASDRKQRRVERLRRAAKLPAGNWLGSMPRHSVLQAAVLNQAPYMFNTAWPKLLWALSM